MVFNMIAILNVYLRNWFFCYLVNWVAQAQSGARTSVLSVL